VRLTQASSVNTDNNQNNRTFAFGDELLLFGALFTGVFLSLTTNVSTETKYKLQWKWVLQHLSELLQQISIGQMEF